MNGSYADLYSGDGCLEKRHPYSTMVSIKKKKNKNNYEKDYWEEEEEEEEIEDDKF